MNTIYTMFKGKSVGFRILLYLFLLLLYSLIGLLIATLITTAMGTGNNAMKLAQAISSTMMFICPPLTLYWLTRDNTKKALGFRKINDIPVMIAGICIMFAALPCINALTLWNENLQLPECLYSVETMMKDMEEKAAIMTETLLDTKSIGGLLINLLVIAIIPAIGEELTFRSVIQQCLVKAFKSPHIGIIVSAIIFSGIHFQFYGFFPRMLLGIFLGYFFYSTKSIWVSILMHFLNNGTAVVIYYLNNIGVVNVDVDTFGYTPNGWFVAASAIITAALLLFAWQKREKSIIEITE